MPSPQPAVVSLGVLQRALSEQRLNSYRVPGDRNELDPVARYLWNMALCATLQSSLHVLEVTLRNAIFRTSLKWVDATRLHMPDVPCWLDARNSSLLYADEAAAVERAKASLSSDPRGRTPGHLVAKLGFGFWVQLTARVYNELRGDGPKLWPRGLPDVFPHKWPPGSKRIVPDHADREMIFNRLHHIRKLRNRIAHHEPIWDQNLQTEYAGILEVLGWMSTRMTAAVTVLDTFPQTLAAGPSPYRDSAAVLLGTGLGKDSGMRETTSDQGSSPPGTPASG